MTPLRMTDLAPGADVADQIRRAPKALLHDHLDGGVRPATILEIVDEIGYAELPADDELALGQWFRESADSGSLVRYLETFDHTLAVMQTEEGLRRIARECALDLAADGVVYAESRYAPEQHLRQGLALEQVVEAVTAGFEEGMALAAEAGTPIRVVSLLTAMRHAAKSREIAEVAVAYRDQGVVGFDIAGAEAGYPPTRHLDAFEYLRRENFHFTIHAGEAFGLPSIWEAIQWCGADRLGHGVRIVDDIEVTGQAPGGGVSGGMGGGIGVGTVDGECVSRSAGPPTSGTPASRWRCAVVERPDRGCRLDRGAPDHPAQGAALSGDRQHRQPPHVRHLDEQGDAPSSTRPADPLRVAVGDDQRDEVGVHPVRRALGDHRTGRQTRLRRSACPPDRVAGQT